MRHRHIILLAILATAAVAAPRAARAGCPAMKEVEYRGKMQKQPAVGKVERQLGGKLFTSDDGFPYPGGKTAQQYINAIKAKETKKFQEDKAKKRWKIYFAAFYTKPLDDLEVIITLFDITKPSDSRQLTSFPVDLDPPPCETSFLSDITLQREQVGVNKKIKMVVSNRKAGTLATGYFEINGEVEKFSGKATFTDEETHEPGEAPPPPPDKEDKVGPPVPEKDPDEDKPIDYNDPKYNTPNLDPEADMKEPPAQHKTRGCGCQGQTDGATLGGSLLLLGLAFLSLRPRRRRG